MYESLFVIITLLYATAILSLIFNHSISFSFNYNLILKNVIPKENISHNSGLNSLIAYPL